MKWKSYDSTLQINRLLCSSFLSVSSSASPNFDTVLASFKSFFIITMDGHLSFLSFVSSPKWPLQTVSLHFSHSIGDVSPHFLNMILLFLFVHHPASRSFSLLSSQNVRSSYKVSTTELRLIVDQDPPAIAVHCNAYYCHYIVNRANFERGKRHLGSKLCFPVVDYIKRRV